MEKQTDEQLAVETLRKHMVPFACSEIYFNKNISDNNTATMPLMALVAMQEYHSIKSEKQLVFIDKCSNEIGRLQKDYSNLLIEQSKEIEHWKKKNILHGLEYSKHTSF